MKRFSTSTVFSITIAVILFCSCASVNAVNESPTRYGWGVNATPGWQLGDGPSSIHLLAGYSRIKFDGGGGHNNFWQFGSQFRYSLTKFPDNGIWLGAEASYLSITSIVDGNSSGSNPHAGGFTIGPMAGYRFKIGRVPSSIYLAPSYLSRGEFKFMGTSSGESSSGFYAKLGLDLHLTSLMHAKGR